MKMILSKNELSKLPQDSTDIYEENLVSHYIIRPQDHALNQLCYTCSAKNYQLLPKQVEIDSLHNELSDEDIGENNPLTNNH